MRDAVLVDGSVSEKQREIVGHWANEAILLRFHANVESGRIRLHDANIEGGKLAGIKPCFDARNTAVLMKTQKDIRGIFDHYDNCNQVWAPMAQHIGASMAYPGGSALWARCGDPELWRPFWNMAGLARQLLNKRDDRNKLSAGSLLDVLHGPIRMSAPSIRERVFWFAGGRYANNGFLYQQVKTRIHMSPSQRSVGAIHAMSSTKRHYRRH